MKTRIIGALLVVVVLGALAVATDTFNTNKPPGVVSIPSSNDNSFKDLKIN